MHKWEEEPVTLPAFACYADFGICKLLLPVPLLYVTNSSIQLVNYRRHARQSARFQKYDSRQMRCVVQVVLAVVARERAKLTSAMLFKPKMCF